MAGRALLAGYHLGLVLNMQSRSLPIHNVFYSVWPSSLSFFLSACIQIQMVPLFFRCDTAWAACEATCLAQRSEYLDSYSYSSVHQLLLWHGKRTTMAIPNKSRCRSISVTGYSVNMTAWLVLSTFEPTREDAIDATSSFFIINVYCYT